MGASPARRIAFDTLRRVGAGGAYASDLLHARLTERVRPEDAALATELTLGVLRWQRLLDFLLERQMGKPIASLDLEVLLALRLGIYQLRFLARVPARAAVNESVELVKSARKRSAASLVNAVLRKASAAARDPVEAYLPPGLPPAERLGILHSHPSWLVERWLERLGEARTTALLEADNRAAHLACVVHEPARHEEVRRALEKEGLRVGDGRLLRTALIARGGSPTRTEAFRRGWISIQDEASQLVPLLLGVEAGNSVLDVCAAPGGKTASLLRAAGPRALVVAGDLHPHRLRAMRRNLERIGLRQARLVALDATTALPFLAGFDRILVDAPCSGTGTLARHPEIRWRLRREELAEFHRRQVALLRASLDSLAARGRLVYSTCSLEPEENEQVVAQALEGAGDVRVSPAAETSALLAPLLAKGVSATGLFDSTGALRTFPPEHHSDGFFAVILEKR